MAGVFHMGQMTLTGIYGWSHYQPPCVSGVLFLIVFLPHDVADNIADSAAA